MESSLDPWDLPVKPKNVIKRPVCRDFKEAFISKLKSTLSTDVEISSEGSKRRRLHTPKFNPDFLNHGNDLKDIPNISFESPSVLAELDCAHHLVSDGPAFQSNQNNQLKENESSDISKSRVLSNLVLFDSNTQEYANFQSNENSFNHNYEEAGQYTGHSKTLQSTNTSEDTSDAIGAARDIEVFSKKWSSHIPEKFITSFCLTDKMSDYKQENLVDSDTVFSSVLLDKVVRDSSIPSARKCKSPAKCILKSRGSLLNSSLLTSLINDLDDPESKFNSFQLRVTEDGVPNSEKIKQNVLSCTIQVDSDEERKDKLLESSIHVTSPTSLLKNISSSRSVPIMPLQYGGSGKVAKSNPIPMQNYRRINLKKKCFSRGGTMRQAFLRRQMKKDKYNKKFSKYQGSNKAPKGSCFYCHQQGHWANKCPMKKMSIKSNTECLSQEDDDCEDVNWRLLDIEDLDRRFLQPSFRDFNMCDLARPVEPALDILSESSLELVKDTMNQGLQQMGHKSFRRGQELVVLRILSHSSTLVVLPTAGGKSLCYQLPAYVFQKLRPPATALVISPLISLMQDQVLTIESGILGAFINSNQSKEDKEIILSDARTGKYAFLLVSPEAIADSDWLLQPGRLPPVSFVCIDEAHCLSDWSHHFRPSYLRVCHILRTRLGITCFLGLSATCTPGTIRNICRHLGFQGSVVRLEDDSNSSNMTDLARLLTAPGYFQPFNTPLPANLLLTASLDTNREEALVRILSHPPFSRLPGILIYCATRDLTDRLAGYIRTALQGVVEKVGRRTLNWTAEAYHAGQTPAKRLQLQKRFMSGRLRVLCATSAFGMGLNKRDLQAVIHYSLPKSFENYVQEVGRVGRRGQASYCHAFLPPALSTDPCEANEIRRHIFSNHIEAITVKRLLLRLFNTARCTCRCPKDSQYTHDSLTLKSDQNEGIHLFGQPSKTSASRTASATSANPSFVCPGHVIAVNPAQLAEELDVKEESIATLLAYLELSDIPAATGQTRPLINVLQPNYRIATIDCYGGPRELARLSQRSIAVSAWLSLSVKREQKSLDIDNATARDRVFQSRQISIDLSTLCNRWGWLPTAVRREIQNLEWDKPNLSASSVHARRTGVNVSFSEWSWWLWLHGTSLPASPTLLDQCLSCLMSRLIKVEQESLISLDRLTRSMAEIALPKAIDVFPASISGPEVTKSSALVDIVTSDNDKSSDCSFHIETPLASETGIKNRRYSSRNANVRKKTALPKNDSTTNSKELDSNLECSKLVQTQCDSLSNERMARSQRAHRLIRIYFSEDDVGKPLQSSCEETLRPSETFILGDAVMPHASGRVENNHDSVKIDWFIWPPALTERQIEIIRVRVREFLHMHAGSIEAGQLTGRTMANIFHGIGTPIFPAQAWSKSHRFWRSQLGMDWPTIRRIATEEILIAASDFRL